VRAVILKRDRSEGGFSLVELMIAAAVLAIGVMGLMASITYCIRADMASDESTLALNGARTMMEEIQSNGSPTSIQAIYSGFDFAVGGLGAQAGDPDGIVGEVTITSSTIAPTPPAPAATMLDVRVTIQWNGSLGDRIFVYSMQVSQH